MNRTANIAGGEPLLCDQGIAPNGIVTRVLSPDQAIQAYVRFCEHAIHSGAQHPLWVESWLSDKHPGERLIELSWKDGKPLIEVRRKGPCSIACFRGSHANSSFPAQRPQIELHLALTVRGKAFTLATMAAERSKRFIKCNRSAHTPAQRIRAALSPRNSQAASRSVGWDGGS